MKILTCLAFLIITLNAFSQGDSPSSQISNGQVMETEVRSEDPPSFEQQRQEYSSERSNNYPDIDRAEEGEWDLESDQLDYENEEEVIY